MGLLTLAALARVLTPNATSHTSLTSPSSGDQPTEERGRRRRRGRDPEKAAESAQRQRDSGAARTRPVISGPLVYAPPPRRPTPAATKDSESVPPLSALPPRFNGASDPRPVQIQEPPEHIHIDTSGSNFDRTNTFPRTNTLPRTNTFPRTNTITYETPTRAPTPPRALEKPANISSSAARDDDAYDDEDGGEPRGRRFRRFATWNTMTSTNTRSFSLPFSGGAPFTRTLTGATTAALRPWWKKLRAYILPDESSPNELEGFVPYYRWSPIGAGVLIPFSILLEIPGLTERWYIQTQNNKTVETQPNPVILDVGMAVSITCALLANVCLVLRFLERRIKLSTQLCIFFLTAHDVINITAVTLFGVQHRYNDGFTYGQAFWMTLCSTIASTITNVFLIYDLIKTREFTDHGSGLTRKQRALIILEIVLLLYIAFGAAINSVLNELSYIDGLYFTTVSIETIGFGDIVPRSTGARVFVCFYIAIGVITIGLFVAMVRDTVLEALELGYRKRVRGLRLRRRDARRYRRWETRWRRAVEWRLRADGQPVWVSERSRSHGEGPRFVGLHGESDWRRSFRAAMCFGARAEAGPSPRAVVGHPRGKILNLGVLSWAQLEEAALEAGVPLDKFIEGGREGLRAGKEKDRQSSGSRPIEKGELAGQLGGADALGDRLAWPTHAGTPTHAQIGRMAAMMTKVALAFVGRSMLPVEEGDSGATEFDVEAQAPAGQGRAHAPDSDRDTSGGTAVGNDQVMGGKMTDSPVEEPADAGSGEGDGADDEEGEMEAVPEEGEGEDAEAAGLGSRKGITLADLGRLAKVPKWMRDFSHGPAAQRAPFSYDQFKEDMDVEEKRAHYAKLTIAWTLFLLFFFVGSGIFCATEGWSYGEAMYFCFIAFTTVGYGDFSPQTPAGRSIFVVWALTGVAAVTILISVVQEAGSSRYKDVLHSRVFDKALKKYRKREAKEAAELPHDAARLQNAYLHASMNVLYRSMSDGNGKAAAEGGALSPTGAPDPETTAQKLSETQVNVQNQLESLPEQIVQHARSFHDYLQYFVGNRYEVMNMETDDAAATIPEEVKKLLDEIAAAEGLSERVKREIFHDKEARNILFMLSVERALKRMIHAAEGALKAISERDTLLALQEEQKQHAARQASRRSLSRSGRSMSIARSVRSTRSVRSARTDASGAEDDGAHGGYYSSPEDGQGTADSATASGSATQPSIDRSRGSSHRSLHRSSTHMRRYPSRAPSRARSLSPSSSRGFPSSQDATMSVRLATEYPHRDSISEALQEQSPVDATPPRLERAESSFYANSDAANHASE